MIFTRESLLRAIQTLSTLPDPSDQRPFVVVPRSMVTKVQEVCGSGVRVIEQAPITIRYTWRPE